VDARPARARVEPRLHGSPVTLDEALAFAAERLRQARLPLFAGLSGDLADIRGALHLAQQTGGVIDHRNADALMRNSRVLQETGWITMSLGAGMMLPLLLRWYWWRFNGYGYAIGTAVGTLGAILQKMFFPSLPEWIAFLIVGGAAIVGMLIGTYGFPATDKDVLRKFFTKTKPMGLWKPVTEEMESQAVRSVKKENRRDLLALVFAIPWQLSLFLTPIHAVIHEWDRFVLFFAVFILSSIGLYFTWYQHLSRGNSQQ